MAKALNRRTFGALEAHKHPKTGKVTSWRARYTGPDTDRHGRSFIDRMTAEAWLNEERILIDRGEWTPPKVREALAHTRSLQAITLREWAERSMANKKLRATTRDRYRRMLDKRILPVLGDVPLAALTRMDVTSWYMTLSVQLAKEADERRARGFKGNTDGRGTLYSAYQVLSSILADAVDHEILDVSPAKVKGGLQYETLHEPVVLTPEQMWHLTDLMPGYLQAFVPLLATTGLRKGEMRALMRRHLVVGLPRGKVCGDQAEVVRCVQGVLPRAWGDWVATNSAAIADVASCFSSVTDIHTPLKRPVIRPYTEKLTPPWCVVAVAEELQPQPPVRRPAAVGQAGRAEPADRLRGRATCRRRHPDGPRSTVHTTTDISDHRPE